MFSKSHELTKTPVLSKENRPSSCSGESLQSILPLGSLAECEGKIPLLEPGSGGAHP